MHTRLPFAKLSLHPDPISKIRRDYVQGKRMIWPTDGRVVLSLSPARMRPASGVRRREGIDAKEHRLRQIERFRLRPCDESRAVRELRSPS